MSLHQSPWFYHIEYHLKGSSFLTCQTCQISLHKNYNLTIIIFWMLEECILTQMCFTYNSEKLREQVKVYNGAKSYETYRTTFSSLGHQSIQTLSCWDDVLNFLFFFICFLLAFAIRSPNQIQFTPLLSSTHLQPTASYLAPRAISSVCRTKAILVLSVQFGSSLASHNFQVRCCQPQYIYNKLLTQSFPI